MRQDLYDRLIKVSRRVERLNQVKHLVAQTQGTSPQGHVASACLAAAEFLAAVTGNSGDTGLVHRVYEEVFAAVENSAAADELFRNDRVASFSKPTYHSNLNEVIRDFRIRVLRVSSGRADR